MPPDICMRVRIANKQARACIRYTIIVCLGETKLELIEANGDASADLVMVIERVLVSPNGGGRGAEPFRVEVITEGTCRDGKDWYWIGRTGDEVLDDVLMLHGDSFDGGDPMSTVTKEYTE